MKVHRAPNVNAITDTKQDDEDDGTEDAYSPTGEESGSEADEEEENAGGESESGAAGTSGATQARKGKGKATAGKHKGGPIPAAAWEQIRLGQDAIDDLVNTIEKKTGLTRRRICHELGLREHGPRSRNRNPWNVVQQKYAQDFPKQPGGTGSLQLIKFSLIHTLNTESTEAFKKRGREYYDDLLDGKTEEEQSAILDALNGWYSARLNSYLDDEWTKGKGKKYFLSTIKAFQAVVSSMRWQ